MPFPASMRYVHAAGAGGAELLSLREMPLPQPKPGEVLVRVLAAGINRPDIAQRKGTYPPPADASPVMGLEIAGEIVAAGTLANRWKPGDYVCALANGGGYAEYCTVPEGQCLPWPKGFNAEQAAALPENYFTVWANLFQLGHLIKGESVLIHGGSSGIGLTAIQLAHATGATVYTTAGNQEKCAACIRAGADAAIEYHHEDFESRIRELKQGRGVDVILDMVGASYFNRNLNSLAVKGRLVIIAVMGGAKASDVNLAQIMSRRITVTGSTMRPRSAEEKAMIADELLQHVWPWLENGTIAPVIDSVFALKDVADAHRRMESSQHIGKIILKISD